jgi:hypothetical protein
MKKLIAIIVLIGLLITGCQPSVTEGRTPITTRGISIIQNANKEAADDFVPTPGGGTYRANVHKEGVENPWLPIKSISVALGSGSDALNINYRDFIETNAGEYRNNIIRVTKKGGHLDSKLELYSTGVPEGLELTDGGRGVGLPGTLGAILVIEIAAYVVPGEYPLEIGLIINGKDYGTVTCTIKIIEITEAKSIDSKVYYSEEGDLTVSLPDGWAVAEGPESLTSMSRLVGQVAFNSWGEKDFWAREVVTGGSHRYSPQVVMSQIPEGGAYVVLFIVHGPPAISGTEPPEYTIEDLSGLIREHDWREDASSAAYYSSFHKWGRGLGLEIACHPGVSDKTVDELNNLLKSWTFDDVPIGDIEWLGIQARKLLPEEVEPLKFSNRAGFHGENGVDRITEVETGENMTIFRFIYQWGSSSHWWTVEVSLRGDATLTGEGGDPLPCD